MSFRHVTLTTTRTITATSNTAPNTAIRIPHHGTGFIKPSLDGGVHELEVEGPTVNKRLRTFGPASRVGLLTSVHSAETVTCTEMTSGIAGAVVSTGLSDLTA